MLVAACHGAPPATAPVAAAASCRVTTPVCAPAIDDATALALVRARCAGCHADGGAAAHPLLAPSALRAERANVAFRLAGCEMPPDATPLPAAERAQLIGWAACVPAAPAPETATNPGTEAPAVR